MSDALMSEQVDELLAAYVAAQSELTAVEHNRDVEMKGETQAGKNYKVKYSYATLAQVLHTIRETLTKNGIWYTQFIRNGEMTTRLMHKSGQWMDTGQIPMPNVNGKPAAVGATVSFFKRYSLSEAMGLATEEDNAGEDDREVNFRARGERRDTEEVRGVATGIEEPAEGWSAWSLDLASKVDVARSDDELNRLRDDNKRLINGVKHVDEAIWRSLMGAFTKRRQAIKPDEGF